MNTLKYIFLFNFIRFEYSLAMDRGALGVLMYIARLWGVAPFSGGTYEISKPLLFYGCTLIFVLATHETINRLISTFRDTKRMLALDYIGVMGDASMVVFFIVGGLSMAGRVRRMAEAIKQLEQIDKITKITRKAIWDTYTIFITIFSIFCSIFHLSVVMTFWYTSEDWKTTLCYVIKGSVLSYVQWQLPAFAARVLVSLKSINKRLHESVNNSNIKCPRTITGAWAVVASNRKDVVENVRRVVNNTNEGSSEGPQHTLRQLATSYGQICDIVRSTTDAEGFLIVLILVYQMLHFQLQLFRIFMWILIPFRENLNYAMFVSIVFSFLHVISLIVFMEPFHQTHVQMKKTNCLVQNMKLTVEEYPALHNEVELFLLALSLADTKYAPLHVCTLNRSLSFKIIGCLISYLLIMLTYGPEFKTPSMIQHSKWN